LVHESLRLESVINKGGAKKQVSLQTSGEGREGEAKGYWTQTGPQVAGERRTDKKGVTTEKTKKKGKRPWKERGDHSR